MINCGQLTIFYVLHDLWEFDLSDPNFSMLKYALIIFPGYLKDSNSF